MPLHIASTITTDRFRLDGKVALVTGGASGVGRATVELLVARGACVAIVDCDEAAGSAAVESIGSDNVSFVYADVGDEASVEEMIRRVVARYGRLDLAHNNAAFGRSGIDLIEVTKQNWDAEIAVDLTGVFLCMKAEIRQMLTTGGGAIVNTGSGASVVAQPGQAAYVAAKHGVIGLTKAAAVEYATRGIRVNAVLPGAVRTPMLELMAERVPELVHRLIDARPMKRPAEPWEVAEAAAWLLSPAAGHVTGASLSVDGGFTAV